MNATVLLLAGGVGSRLNILVENRAKPAVPFGGLYRIIDFTLSNVMNSGLSHVGVLTQYKPLSLMDHLGNGAAWDMAGRSRGVKILPPRTGSRDSDWYRGTADAVRQNLDFLKKHAAPETMVLSGDHIYRMDYADLIGFHRDHQAAITIATMVVDGDEIKQYGTAITDDEGRIMEWEEKPEKPRSNLASMGVYVFDTAYLIDFLETNRKALDFGHDLIPGAIESVRVMAYPFRGYWRDVGTVAAYWQANMEIIGPDSLISPEAWGVRSNPEADERVADRPPARFASGCRVEGALISAGCRISGTVINSVLSPGVVVAPGAVVRDSIIFTDTVVGPDAECDLVIVDKEVEIGRGARVGTGDRRTVANRKNPSHLASGISLVGKRARIGAGARVGRNCVVGSGIRMAPGSELAAGESC